MCVYIYIYIYMYMYIYVYIYIYIERERERHTSLSLSLSMCIYIYIYIYIPTILWKTNRILHRTFEVTFGILLRSRIQSDTRILADSGPVHQAFVTRCERTQRECKRLIGTNWAFTGKSTTNWARDLNISSYPTRRQCQVHKARTNDCVF